MKYRVGIDLGGTNIKVGIVDESEQIVARHSIPTQVERTYQEVIKSMAEAVEEALLQKGIDKKDCIKIGIGSPGIVDSQQGVIVYSNNFGWRDIKLAEQLQQYLDLPVYMSNDANCAALGEVIAGAARGCKNVILLTLGTGVGSGIVLEGKVFEGGYPGGAECGHTILVAGGEPCTCGRNGCFEAYCSATALIRDTKRAAELHPESLINNICMNNLENINGLTPFTAAAEKDLAAQAVIDSYIGHLSEGIANLINIFRPDRVLLSGGICNQGEILTIPINQCLKKLCFGGEDTYIAPVMKATLGNDAGIIGAASLSA